MLKWCAYCQHYLGEKPPYENFELTHGICENCRSRARHKDSTHIARIQPIVDFYNKLRDQALAGERLQVEAIITQSRQLGINPLDMAIGILQPALNEIGRLYAEGKVTVAKEHAFTTTIDKMISHLFTITPAMKSCQEMPPAVLLTCVDGNYHWLGLKLLELNLLEEQIPVRVYIPSLPREEIIQIAAELRPTVLGLSIYDRAQAVEALRIRDGIQVMTQNSYTPKIAVGGHGARDFLDEKGVEQHLDGDLGYFRQSLDFINFLKSFLTK